MEPRLGSPGTVPALSQLPFRKHGLEIDWLRRFGDGVFSTAFALVVVAAASSGCASLKPYERGKLAHPTMLLGDLSRAGSAHVYAIHEGAVGGDSGAKGGCGCN